jgi:hypothetical protein
MILCVTRYDALARQGPVIFLTNRNDLSWITGSKVMKRVVTGDTGDASDQQRQGNRFVGAGNHGTNCTSKLIDVSYQPAARRRATNAA